MFGQPAAGYEGPCVEPDWQHALDVGACLIRGHTGLEPAEHLKVEPPDGLLGDLEATHGEYYVRRRVEELEVARHDAHHERRFRIDIDFPAQGRVVATELPLPERVGKDDRGGSLRGGSVLLAREQTAAHRPHTEGLKSPVCDNQNIETRRLIAIGQRREVLGVLP